MGNAFTREESMKKVVLVGCVLTCLILASANTIPAQDFNALLDAVEKIESNLKQLVKQEAQTRNQEMAKLRLELKAVTSYGPGGTQSDMGSIITELEYLRQEVALWKSFFEKNKGALASLDGGVIPTQDNEHEIQELSDRLSSLSETLDQVAANKGTSSHGPAWQEQIQFSGFVDASDFNDHNAGSSSFGLDQMELDVIKEFGGKALLRADIEYVSDGMGGFGMDLEQGYMSYSVGSSTSWTFTFGKFNAPIGFELLDAPDMYQYSHAIVFNNGLPTNLTGFMVTTEFPSVVDWTVYLVNGWDVNTDNNKGKTVGTRVGFTPFDNLNFGFSAITGTEDDLGDSRRTVLDWDLTYNPMEFWTVGWEFNYGTESAGMPDGSSGNWTGFLIMNNWALGESFGLTARFDHFNDKDGLRTGTPQKWNAFAISPSMLIIDGLGTLFEIRYDWSDQNVFTDSYGEPKDNQVTSGLEFTYGF